MRTKPFAMLSLAAALGSISLAGCDLDVGDINNPPLSDLEDAPNAVLINAAATGLLAGNRRNVGAGNGYVAQLGILGREAYNFDVADPRFFGELLQGSLNPGSPFGGNFWAFPYANIRLGHILLRALDKVSDDELSAASKQGIRGFTHTIQAMDLLEVTVTHDTNGVVIDTDKPIVEPPAVQELGAVVAPAAAYAEIARLLDAALPELDAAGSAFSFSLSEGYRGFDTPATFRTLNRALRARVAVYTKDYATALTALAGSFINEDPDDEDFDLDAGAYHTFTTGVGDVRNGLLNPNIYLHPSVAADVSRNGALVDDRLTRKTELAARPGAGNGVSATLNFTDMYGSPESPIPVIRNEELILLRAEALWFTMQQVQAMAALNFVRTESGGLTPLVGIPSESTFIDQLLHERRYSLLFEGGHRWIDLRRFARPLPLDPKEEDEDPDVRNVRYPLPRTECNARPGEPACMLGST